METTTPTAVPQSGVVSGSPAEKPAGMPEIPADEAGVSSLLEKLSKPGGEQNQGAPPVAAPPEGEQPAQPQVPDKFKNPDGTVNTEALTKSYLEAEKQLSQHFQMKSEYGKTQEQLAEMQDYVKRLDDWREQTMAAQNPEKKDGDYTPEEIEEMRTNPREFIKKEVSQGLKSFQQEQKVEAELSGAIDSAINYGRANVDGFNKLEPEIAKLMESEAYTRHPESVKQAYYAVLGQKMPEMLKESKNMGFTEGYKKHGEEMGKHVESGGKSSLPMSGGSLTPEAIKNMSVEDLEKIIPTIDTRVRREGVI